MRHYSKIVPANDKQERLQDCTLCLDLAGPLRLTDASGSELTPCLRKAQGLLALIGTSPGLRRSRVWLQDKLWSDRGQAQGAANLRQCLRRLRAALGKRADCLIATSGWIALDPARVRVRAHLNTADVDAGAEFLEGIDIDDPEFEDWLREQRLFYSERARETATAPVSAVEPLTHREFAGILDRERIGAMVAAAALAGYLMERRDAPPGQRRPVQDDLLEALRSRHVAQAHEVVRAIVPYLAVHRSGGWSAVPRSIGIELEAAHALAAVARGALRGAWSAFKADGEIRRLGNCGKLSATGVVRRLSAMVCR